MSTELEQLRYQNGILNRSIEIYKEEISKLKTERNKYKKALEMATQECEEELHRISRVFDTTGTCAQSAAVMRKFANGELREVVHGKWEEERDPYGKLVGWNHKECGRMTQEATKYCPCCGALMDGKENTI
jgi:hypothetical protein